MNKSASTSVSDLINMVKVDDPSALPNLIKAIKKTIPSKKSRRTKMPKVDTNLNKTFRIKRINYVVLADIHNGDEFTYDAQIVKILDGEPHLQIGDTFPISKRELELTGRPATHE